MLKKITATLFILIVQINIYADDTAWCIQVMRCSTFENADRIYGKLSSRQSKMIEKSRGSYTVTVGFYYTRKDVLNALGDMKTSFPDAFIKKCGKAGKSKTPLATASSPENKQSQADRRSLHKAGAESTPAKAPDAISPVKQKTRIDQMTPQNKDDAPALTNRSEKSVNEKAKKDVDKQIKPPAARQMEQNKKSKAPELGFTELLTKGMQAYEAKRYREAISTLSQYASLAPRSEHCSTAMLVIAKSLDDMRRPLQAAKIYSLILEQFPNSPDAFTAMVAMADLSVNNSSLNYPVFMIGADFIKQPIAAYDKALTMDLPLQMMQAIRLKKAHALLKQRRYQEGYVECLTLLHDHPQTTYKIEVFDVMRSCAIALIESHHQAGDHIAAVKMYFEAKEKDLIDDDDRQALVMSSLSLARIGMHDFSREILKRLRLKKGGDKSPGLDQVESEIQSSVAAQADANLPVGERWKLYETGRAQLRAGDLQAAQKTLNQLKAVSTDPFWTGITDYALEDNNWNRKYRTQSNKKD